MLGRFHLGRPGIQQPGAGAVGGADRQHGRPFDKVDLEGTGIARRKSVPPDFPEKVGRGTLDGIEGLPLDPQLGGLDSSAQV